MAVSGSVSTPAGTENQHQSPTVMPINSHAHSRFQINCHVSVMHQQHSAHTAGRTSILKCLMPPAPCLMLEL